MITVTRVARPPSFLRAPCAGGRRCGRLRLRRCPPRMSPPSFSRRSARPPRPRVFLVVAVAPPPRFLLRCGRGAQCAPRPRPLLFLLRCGRGAQCAPRPRPLLFASLRAGCAVRAPSSPLAFCFAAGGVRSARPVLAPCFLLRCGRGAQCAPRPRPLLFLSVARRSRGNSLRSPLRSDLGIMAVPSNSDTEEWPHLR